LHKGYLARFVDVGIVSPGTCTNRVGGQPSGGWTSYNDVDGLPYSDLIDTLPRSFYSLSVHQFPFLIAGGSFPGHLPQAGHSCKIGTTPQMASRYA
jgi:hypothetical protein